jgi:methylated-DNA-[protein]-cysteine S-methyltransferase
MGQSDKSPRTRGITAADEPALSIFPTNFGWCGVLGRAGRVSAILIGHSDAAEVRQAVRRRLNEFGLADAPRESNWHPELRRRLERYGIGEPVVFDDINLDLPDGTTFQNRVRAVTRRIPYGQTMTYGELAQRAGFARAARAVGSVMASNRFPIVIPCHRVTAAAGKLGGFSAPRGIDLKSSLLAMESEMSKAAPGAIRRGPDANARIA